LTLSVPTPCHLAYLTYGKGCWLPEKVRFDEALAFSFAADNRLSRSRHHPCLRPCSAQKSCFCHGLPSHLGQRICGKRRTGIARQDLAPLRAQARRFPDRPPAPGAGTAEGHSATNELHTIIFKYLLRVAMPYRDPLTSSAHQLCPAASLIVLLLWIYYSSQIPFVGREFTHVSANRFGSPLTLPTCGNLVCLAELASRTQCRKARACDLLQLPDDCRAVDYHVISRYGSAIQATYWRSKKRPSWHPMRRLGRRLQSLQASSASRNCGRLARGILDRASARG
jgi:hypothetical protein